MNDEEQLARLRDAPTNGPDDLIERALAYAALDHHEEALVDLDAAIALDPAFDGCLALHLRGDCLLALGRVEEALGAYERAIDGGARRWEAFLHASLAAWDTGSAEDAIGWLDRYLALEVSPRDDGDNEDDDARGEARVRKAHVLAELGRDAEAVVEVAAALEDAPSPELLEEAADFHAVVRGAWADALPLYERAWDEDPTPGLGLKLGFTLANVGRDADAIEQLRAVLEAEPELQELAQSEGWRERLRDPSILERL